MAAISVNINFDKVAKDISRRFELLKDKDYLLRPLAIETIPNIKQRVHIEGKGTDGTAIGTYSSGYLKLRQKKFKRSSDSRIIVSLTRQLENDYAVVGTTTGYGIGFNNPFNAQKAVYVEQIKRKIIFNLSADEKKYIEERVQQLVNGAINP
jgi:phage gpG-like protein